MKLGALVVAATLCVALAPLACGDASSPCAPLSPHDAGGCGQSYGVDYDPASQTGCTFVNGSGTADTCLALCGQAATCDLITFTTVDCNVPCGD
jgi:hypothetical protein